MNAEAYEKARGIQTACCVHCGKIVLVIPHGDGAHSIFDIQSSNRLQHICFMPRNVLTQYGAWWNGSRASDSGE